MEDYLLYSLSRKVSRVNGRYGLYYYSQQASEQSNVIELVSIDIG